MLKQWQKEAPEWKKGWRVGAEKSASRSKKDLCRSALAHCVLCGRRCGIDRTTGLRGPCGGGVEPRVARWLAHMGEEPPLSGDRGSGTIFFSGCSLRCLFCQNHEISQKRRGQEVSLERLAGIMLELEASGCHNVNLVSPTHYAPQIAVAIEQARRRGLSVPIVYNTHGYDSPEALSLLEGKVDIYLPDMKYACDSTAEELSGASGYVEKNREALARMFSQVGFLEEDPESGLARKGMLVRVLVLPGGLAGVKESLVWLAERFSPAIDVSLMAQYVPLHRALGRPPLDRRLFPAEYQEAVETAEALGFENLWVQDLAGSEAGVPDFSSETPFRFD